MGKNIQNKMEEEPQSTKVEKVEKVAKRSNQITKAVTLATKPKTHSMDIESTRQKIKKKIEKVIKKPSRPAKKTKTQFNIAEKHEFNPEVYKEFEKIYDASRNEVPNPKGLTRGKKKRLILKQKLEKKHLFKEYLSKLKDKKNKSALLEMDLLKNILGGMEVEAQKDNEKLEKDKHKGTNSKNWNMIANEESLRTQKILEHPVFLSNPLEIIKTHLMNSIALNAKNAPKKK